MIAASNNPKQPATSKHRKKKADESVDGITSHRAVGNPSAEDATDPCWIHQPASLSNCVISACGRGLYSTVLVRGGY